jgi:hypothetical protein
MAIFREQKPLNRSIQKFEQFITSARPTSRPKFIMIRRRVSAPHIGEIYGWRSFFFFFRWLLGQAHSRPRALQPHVLYINRRGSGQGGAFWGSHRYVLSFGGVIPQKPLIFGPPMGIPSLNVYGHISAQDRLITTLNSSNYASRQDTQCAIVKNEGWGHCRGQTYKSLFQRQIYSQIWNHSRKCRITF